MTRIQVGKLEPTRTQVPPPLAPSALTSGPGNRRCHYDSIPEILEADVRLSATQTIR
jgi:hypothetical protein